MTNTFDAKGLLAELSELALRMEDQVGPLVSESDDYEQLQSHIQSLVSEIQTHLDQFEMYEKKGYLVEESPLPKYCKCGTWPIEEYGDECPSCEEELNI